MRHVKLFETFSSAYSPELSGMKPSDISDDMFVEFSEKFINDGNADALEHLIKLYSDNIKSKPSGLSMASIKNVNSALDKAEEMGLKLKLSPADYGQDSFMAMKADSRRADVSNKLGMAKNPKIRTLISEINVKIEDTVQSLIGDLMKTSGERPSPEDKENIKKDILRQIEEFIGTIPTNR